MVERHEKYDAIVEAVGLSKGRISQIVKEASTRSESHEESQSAEIKLPKQGPKLETKLESAMLPLEFRPAVTPMRMWERMESWLVENQARNDALETFYRLCFGAKKKWRAIARTTIDVLKEMGVF